MNKRKRVAWAKHRAKAKKMEERRKALPRALRQQSRRSAPAAAGA
jgi:hypothetical protein